MYYNNCMIVVRTPTTREEFKTYYTLRYQVLREPLGLPRGTEKDDYEPIAQHLIAMDDETKEIAGVIKYSQNEPCDCRFSHLAVKDAYQGKGIGKLLVDTVEKKAREKGMKCIGTLSRLSAMPFYEKLGYKKKGEVQKIFDTLDMIWMEKPLT